jgi:hypothetical protein
VQGYWDRDGQETEVHILFTKASKHPDDVLKISKDWAGEAIASLSAEVMRGIKTPYPVPCTSSMAEGFGVLDEGLMTAWE